MADIKVKYLSYEGLKTYNSQIKDFYSNPSKIAGRVGLSDNATKLATPIKIELTGAVTGDLNNFDGSQSRTISTTLTPLTGTHSISVTGNAGTATNFASAKSIYLTGPITGTASGGNTAEGWTLATSVTDSSITNIKLAGGITNDKLVNNGITIGDTFISLGDIAGKAKKPILNAFITGTFVGDLTGNANTATKATQDADGNIIVTTYATKSYVDSKISSAIKYKGSVETYAALQAITVKENGDVYNVTNDPDITKNKSYIWSTQDNSWSVFGAYYGPATTTDLGLVKIEASANITNVGGSISITGSNVSSALGYSPIKGVKVNGTTLIPVENIVNVEVPTDYATQADIDASFTYNKITTGLGFEPINVVQLNGIALTKTNNTVNVDLSNYDTKSEVDEKIESRLTSLYKFKGSVQTYGDLPSIGQQVGDTYNVIQGNNPETQRPDWPAFQPGTNFAWDGDEWDALGGTLDLSNYYKKSEVDTLLAGKANTSHSHNDLYYTKLEIDTKIANLKTWVESKITEVLTDAANRGLVNDIRTYASFEDFPAVGIEDVQYVAADTQIEYQWKSTGVGTGEYVPINEITSKQDIEDMFK